MKAILTDLLAIIGVVLSWSAAGSSCSDVWICIGSDGAGILCWCGCTAKTAIIS